MRSRTVGAQAFDRVKARLSQSRETRMMASVIRAATVLDAEGISRVILAALRHSNAADYDAATLARVARSFTPQAVVALLGRRVVWVAMEDGLVVATASLEKDVVRSVSGCLIPPLKASRCPGRSGLVPRWAAQRPRQSQLRS